MTPSSLAAAAAAGPSSTDWITSVTAILALLVAGAAAWWARGSKRAADKNAAEAARSADAAETAASHAGTSAQASLESAAAASLSAQADTKLARMQVESEHHSYDPRKSPHRFVYRRDALAGNHLNLFFEFTPERNYEYSAFVVNRNSGKSTSLEGPFASAGETQRIHVEDVTGKPRVAMFDTRMVVLQFWPPREGSEGQTWWCHCDRNSEKGGPAHWTWTVPMELEDPQQAPNIW